MWLWIVECCNFSSDASSRGFVESCREELAYQRWLALDSGWAWRKRDLRECEKT